VLVSGHNSVATNRRLAVISPAVFLGRSWSDTSSIHVRPGCSATRGLLLNCSRVVPLPSHLSCALRLPLPIISVPAFMYRALSAFVLGRQITPVQNENQVARFVAKSFAGCRRAPSVVVRWR